MTAGIDNYDELVSTVNRFLKSSTVTPEIPGLIVLAEASLRRRLKIGSNRVTDTLTPTGDAIELPGDYGGLVDLSCPEVAKPIEQVGLQQLRSMPATSGPAEMFTIDAGRLLFWPTVPSSVDIIYHQKLPALTADDPTNWLLLQAPDAYLMATLVESEPFNMSDARIPLWKAKLETIIAEIRDDDAEKEWGRGPLVCRRIEA